MATGKSNSSLSLEKIIHPEPSSSSILSGSDEESFVVLWKETDSKQAEDVSDAFLDNSFVNEVKTVNELPSELPSDLNQCSQSQAKDKIIDNNPNTFKKKEIAEDFQVDQLMVLSKMQFDKEEMDQDSSGVISITTLSTDLSSEQVQKKISDLIEENTRLKYLIVQNNATMKSQCRKIVAWQEDVQKVHETHRTKIIEAKEFIEKLKMDKYNLARELEQMKKNKDIQDEILREKEQIIENKICRSTDVDAKVKELELVMNKMTLENTILKAKIEECQKEVIKLQSELFVNKNEAEEAKSKLIKAKSVYEDDLKSLNLIIATLRSEEYPLVDSSVNSSIDFAQMNSKTATYAQIESLNKEVLYLKSQVDKSQTRMDEIHALKTQLGLYKADFEAEKNAKELLQIEKTKLREDINKLQGAYNTLQEKMNTIREKYIVIPKSQGYERPDEECCIQ